MRALDAEAPHQHVQGPHIRHLNAHVTAHRAPTHGDVPQLHDRGPTARYGTVSYVSRTVPPQRRQAGVACVTVCYVSSPPRIDGAAEGPTRGRSEDIAGKGPRKSEASVSLPHMCIRDRLVRPERALRRWA